MRADIRQDGTLIVGETTESPEEQSKALADATDRRTTPRYGPLALAAFRGREAEVTSLVRTSMDEFNARGEGLGITLANWVMAVLGNSLGRYEAALEAANKASQHAVKSLSPFGELVVTPFKRLIEASR